jgi:hypothetical protein
MWTTDSLAHTKWCPYVRVEGNNRFNNSLTDGFQDTQQMYHCLGSKCMLWREISSPHLKHGATLEGAGYCGLGGHPEIAPPATPG